MRWLFEVFFTGKLVRLFKFFEKRGPTPDLEPHVRVLKDAGLEPEFAHLTELLAVQLDAEVRIVGRAKDKILSIETDDEVIARVSIHKAGSRSKRYVVVRLSTYHPGLRAWFGLAFMAYQLRFMKLEPVVAKKKGHKTPRGQ